MLVGKTITYDTGGYSLKSEQRHEGHEVRHVRRAAVFGAMQAIASLKLPIRVFGVLPCQKHGQ